MRKNLRLGFAIATILLVSTFSGLAFGQSQVPSAPSALISNVFVETDLRQALEDISSQSGVNVVADPSVQGVVTVALQNVPLDKALALVLAGTGYQVQKTNDYYLVFSPDEGNATFTSVAETKVIQLQNITADTAHNLLPNSLQRFVRVDTAGNKLAVTAPSLLMERIVSDLSKLDVPSSASSDFVALNYVKATTLKSLLPDALQAFVKVDDQRNTLAISGSPDTNREIRREIAELDVPRGPGSFDVPEVYPTRVVKLANVTATAAMAMLPASLQNFVRPDAESNSLAVSVPNSVLKEVLADISAVDAPRKHILLDARVVALERADLLDFGGEWQWPTISAGTALSDAGGWPWELRIGYTTGRQFTDALSLTLNLLSQNNEATIVSSPQVMAQDGKQAEIKVTTEEYFPITSTDAAAGISVQTDLQKIETGTILDITPQIGSDGKLTLDMSIEVSDVVARGQQNLPVVSRRTAHSTVQIENGGTAAVAGLVDTRSQLSDSGVPGTADLPLLGRAFRTENLNHQTRQVAVFITATIVDDSDQLAATGRKDSPPIQVQSAATYRQQLRDALQQIVGGPTK